MTTTQRIRSRTIGASVPNSSQHEPLMPPAVPIAPLEDDLARTPNGRGRPRRRLLSPVATTDVRSVSARLAGPLLRVALATVFIWFGALKLTGHSPVAGLFRDTFPWANPQLVLVGLGAVEVALGLGLIVFRRGVVVPLAMAMHLCGTFITFVLLPERMFHQGNPLLLTMDAEFVGKNLVLIAALVALVGTQVSTASARHQPTSS
jgi:putative oxidoreductase